MLKVYLADFIERTDLEGPGYRIAVWFSGCSIRCKGCCNPHLFDQNEDQKIYLEELFNKIREVQKFYSDIEGVSVLGGEPFDQPEALLSLLKFSKGLNLSTMVFSGYTLKHIQKSQHSRILDSIDLLVDGPYIESKRVENRRWIGSSNQGLHFMNNRYNASMPCFSMPNEMELKWKDGELRIYGFPVNLVSEIEKSNKDSISKTLNILDGDDIKHS